MRRRSNPTIGLARWSRDEQHSSWRWNELTSDRQRVSQEAARRPLESALSRAAPQQFRQSGPDSIGVMDRAARTGVPDNSLAAGQTGSLLRESLSAR